MSRKEIIERLSMALELAICKNSTCGNLGSLRKVKDDPSMFLAEHTEINHPWMGKLIDSKNWNWKRLVADVVKASRIDIPLCTRGCLFSNHKETTP